MTIISLCMFQSTEKAEIAAFTRKILVLQKNSKKPFLKKLLCEAIETKLKATETKKKKIQQLQPLLLLLLDTRFS